MAGMTRAAIYAAIDAERARQAERWRAPHYWGEGDCSAPTVAPIVKASVLAEECGEVARAVLDLDPAAVRRELVQVAAVAVAWLESYPAEGETLWPS
jgi:NTP pyrophosphatase (non-canonical NTP hydrolase)